MYVMLSYEFSVEGHSEVFVPEFSVGGFIGRIGGFDGEEAGLFEIQPCVDRDEVQGTERHPVVPESFLVGGVSIIG